MLLVLWGGIAGAVTLDGIEAVQLAGLCPGAVEEVPGTSCLGERSAIPELTNNTGACEGDFVPLHPWAEPEMSADVFLQFAAQAAAQETWACPVAFTADDYINLSGVAEHHATVGSKAKPTLEPRDAIHESLGIAEVRLCALRHRARPNHLRTSRHGAIKLAWWPPLLVIPGLAASVLSVCGIVRNRSRRLRVEF